MRFKWVPAPPDSVAAVDEARQAIPLVPVRESDCQRRLVDRTTETGIDDRDDAQRWLTFLRALRAVERNASGYRRCRTELTATELAERLIDGVYGAREVHDVLTAADGPVSVDVLIEQSTVELPTWERHHHGSDHERVRRRRLRRLLEWFVRCDVAERAADGYEMSNR